MAITGSGEAGDFNSAIAHYTEAIRLNPRLAEAYYNRGGEYRKKGQNAKADEDFARATKFGY